MQRLILIILSSFFLMLSCGRSKPKGTLSEKTMIDLMTDVHLVDGYLNTLPVDSTRKIIDGLYEHVFEKYGIDSVRFQTNIAYYLGNPILSKELYAGVTEKLNTYESDFRQTDSLRNVFVSDSIRVVQRYQRLKEAARKLILDVELDTIPLTYRTQQNDFMESAGLQAITTYQPAIVLPESNHADDPDESAEEEVIDSSISASPVPQADELKRPIKTPAAQRQLITPRPIRQHDSIEPVIKEVDKPVEN